MNGEYVGRWNLGREGLDELIYDEVWSSSPRGRPLSLSLPFVAGANMHRGETVRACFDNLLPDSLEIRARAAARFRARSTSAFDLLAEIGRDCVGAVQLLPVGAPAEDTARIQATPLDEAGVAGMLRGVTRATRLGEADAGGENFRISIAGAQEKTALLHHEGQWYLPHGATPTTHILKLPMGLIGNMRLDLRHSIENEWLCSRILHAYGLPVAECQPLQFEDVKVLAVRRFDRAWQQGASGPWLARLPQEDFCQATGTPAFRKYEADGGPGIDQILGILATSAAARTDQRVFFLAQLLFWMLRAPDGHAKNFSIFLRPGGAYCLTPLYDVLSGWPLIGQGPDRIPSQRIRLAMAVRGRNAHWKMQEILPRHWIALGKRHGISTVDGASVEALIEDIVQRTRQVIAEVEAELPAGFPAGVSDPILQGLSTSARALLAG